MIFALAALAQEDHRAPVVAPVAVEAAPIPAGPPRTITVHAGEPLAPAIAGLPSGSTLILGAGRHAGPMYIDRTLTVRGEAGAVLTGAGVGSVLLVAAPDTVVRDLRVTGGGHLSNDDDSGVVVAADRVLLERVTVDDVYLGIDFRQASYGVVRDCSISGDPTQPFGRRGDAIRLWESNHNRVEHNTIRDTRDLVVWYATANTIIDNVVTGSRYGTHLMHSDENIVEGNRFLDDVVGVFVMYSTSITLRGNHVIGSLGPAGVGFGFKESDGVIVEDNVLVRNTTGLFLDTTPHNLTGLARFAQNLIAANEVGIRFHGPQYGGDIVENVFVANRMIAAADGNVDAGKYRVENNQWSDYAGYDLDGDGRGDLPFEARSLSASITERAPILTFFSSTPAMALLDLFAEAFPMFRPAAVLTDAAPSMSLPTSWSPR